MRDEGFDQVTAGALQGFGTAEVGGISFHEVWIEIVLANEQAKLVPESGLSVGMAVAITVKRPCMI